MIYLLKTEHVTGPDGHYVSAQIKRGIDVLAAGAGADESIAILHAALQLNGIGATVGEIKHLVDMPPIEGMVWGVWDHARLAHGEGSTLAGLYSTRDKAKQHIEGEEGQADAYDDADTLLMGIEEHKVQ